VHNPTVGGEIITVDNRVRGKKHVAPHSVLRLIRCATDHGGKFMAHQTRRVQTGTTCFFPLSSCTQAYACSAAGRFARRNSACRAASFTAVHRSYKSMSARHITLTNVRSLKCVCTRTSYGRPQQLQIYEYTADSAYERTYVRTKCVCTRTNTRINATCVFSDARDAS
jgi:hypothetical protein